MPPVDVHTFLSNYQDFRTTQNQVDGNDIRIKRFNTIAKEREGLRRQKSTLQSFRDFLDNLQHARQNKNLDPTVEREFKRDISSTIADNWLQGVTTESGGYLQGVQFALGMGLISSMDFNALDASLSSMIAGSANAISEKFGYTFDAPDPSQKLRALINLATQLRNAKIVVTEKKITIPTEITGQIEDQYEYIYAEAKLLLTEYVHNHVVLPDLELAASQLQSIDSEIETLRLELKRIDDFQSFTARLLRKAGFETDIDGLLKKKENN